MKKQVCMIAYTNYLSDARVRREAETLASTKEFEVSFLVLMEGKRPATYQNNGVNIIELNMRKYMGKNKLQYLLSYLKFMLLSLFRLNKLLFSHKLDIVHVHNMPNFIVFAAILPRISGKKIILDIHDSMPETYSAKFGKETKNPLFKLLCLEEILCCRFANKIICVNHVQRDELNNRSIPSNKVTISMNVPDPKWFSVTKEMKNKKSNESCNLVYHGTIVKRLGVDLAIGAVANLVKTNSSIHFYILGDGDDAEECIDLIKSLKAENFIHLNKRMIPLEDLTNFLRDMDIGVVSNRKNVATELMLPVKMLEYIALEIPVVVPRLRAIEYYFSDDMVSYFDPGNNDSLSHAILDLVEDKHKRKIHVKNAKKFLKQYGWTTHQKDLIDLYENLVTKGG